MKNAPPTHSIFIADDDEDDQLLLQHAFSIYSPESRLIFATDGLVLFDALNQAGKEPCLIILDINMPRLNGFEALINLRQSPRFHQTPIVILTTSAEQSDRERAFALGANEYLTKPFTQEELGEMVCHLRQAWHLEECV